MGPLETLLAIEEIKQLKARYLRCFDTKDWEGWLDVFTDDVSLAFGVAVSEPGDDHVAMELNGKPALRDYVVGYTATAQTVHHCHTPEISFASDTEARGIWAMEDIVDHGTDLIHGFGHYRETYRKLDCGWRIARVRLTRLRISKISRDRIAL